MNLLNKNVIRSVTMVSVFFCLLWLAGLGWAVGEYYAGKPDKIPEKNIVEKRAENKKDLHIVALGDSLTRGTGDETGKGYVGVLMDEIKEKSKQDVLLTNLGITGQRSEQLMEQIQQTEVKRQLQNSDMIVIT